LAQKDKIRYFEQNGKIKKSSPQGSQKSLPKSQSSGSKAAKNAQKPPATSDSASDSSRSSKSDKNSEKSDSATSQEAIKPAKSAYQFFWDAKYEPYKGKFSHLNSAEITEIVNDEWQDIQRKPAKWPFNKLMKEDAEWYKREIKKRETIQKMIDKKMGGDSYNPKKGEKTKVPAAAVVSQKV